MHSTCPAVQTAADSLWASNTLSDAHMTSVNHTPEMQTSALTNLQPFSKHQMHRLAHKYTCEEEMTDCHHCRKVPWERPMLARH